MKAITIIKNIMLMATLTASLNANAGLITFNFETNLSDTDHSVSYISEGYNLTVEALAPNGTDRNVHRALPGLGVSSNQGQDRIGSFNQFSGESLFFALENATFESVRIFFGNTGANTLEGSDSALITFNGGFSTTLSNLDNWTSPEVTSENFFVRAMPTNGTSGNGFRIREVQFNIIDNQVSSVPEPSSFVLLLLPLLAMFMRRKSNV